MKSRSRKLSGANKRMPRKKGTIIGFKRNGENVAEITTAVSTEDENPAIPLLKDVEISW